MHPILFASISPTVRHPRAALAGAVMIFAAGVSADAQTLRPSLSNESLETDQLVSVREDTRIRASSDPFVASPVNQKAFAEPRQQAPAGTSGASPLLNSPSAPEQIGAPRNVDGAFDATGIALGSGRLFPVLEQSLGVTSNADFTRNGESSAFSQTEGRAAWQSDWSRHSLRGEIGGSAIHYFNGESDAVYAIDFNSQLGIDIIDSWKLLLGSNYQFTTETAASDDLEALGLATLADRPIIHRFGAFAQIEHTIGRLTGSLRGSIDREVFGDLNFSDGTSTGQASRNNTVVAATGRLAFEISPALSPFIQASIGRRQFHAASSTAGSERDASLYDLRGGIAVNLGEKLKGELALGVGLDDADDTSIDSEPYFALNGSLTWSPERATTITGAFATEYIATTVAGGSDSVSREISLAATRDIRPDLSVNGRIAVAWERALDDETKRSAVAELGADWRFNRTMSLFGRLGFESVSASDPTSEYDAATARIGVRLQR